MICQICGYESDKLQSHIRTAHNMSPMDYWVKYLSPDGQLHHCICGEPITWFAQGSFKNGPARFCSRECKYKGHSQDMKVMHENGVYEGTNHLGAYNKLEKHRQEARNAAYARRLDKESTGFNSEYSDRLRNMNNIISRFPAESERFIYLLEFPDKLKLGSSHDMYRRLYNLAPEKVLFQLRGPCHEIAKLECDLFIKYKYYTLLDDTKSFYTEFISKDALDQLMIEFKILSEKYISAI